MVGALLREQAIRIALVVESDGPTADALTELLQDEGFQVLVIGELPDLVEAKRLHPELIVLGRPGTIARADSEWVNALKADPQTSGIPIIALSHGLRDVQRNASTLRSFMRAFGAHPWTLVQERDLASTYLD